MFGFLMLGCIAGVVIVVVTLSRVNSLSHKIMVLEWEVEKLKAAIKAMIEPPEKLRVPTAAPTPIRPPRHAVNAPVQPQALPAIPVPVHTPPTPSRTREEWEAFVGGKVLNRIGALALIIGVGFFLKYAFDNNWITESMRVAIGVITGVGILLGAARSHRKGLEIFAQGLFGAGISILYLSVYAAFNYYHLVSQLTAFGCMAGVTVTALSIALRYDSLAISVLAWGGGFLTPFLLSTHEANEVGLFTYIALLQAGLIAIVIRRPAWIILELLTLIGSYIVFSLWYKEYYESDAIFTTIAFLTIFWGLFVLSEIRKVLSGDGSHEFRQVLGLLNVAVFFAYMHSLIDPVYHEWMGATTLLIGCVYLSQGLLFVRKGEIASRLTAQNILTAAILLVIATSIQFKGFTTVIFWSIEAVLLVWSGSRFNYRYISYAGLGLLALSLLKFASTPGAFNYIPLREFDLLLNYRALTYAVLALAAGGCSIFARSNDRELLPGLRSALQAGWIVILFVFIIAEVNDFFNQRSSATPDSRLIVLWLQYAKMMTLLCCWTVYSLIVAFAGLRTSAIALIVSGLIVLTAATMVAFIRGIAFEPIEYYRPLLNLRALAVLVVLAGSFLHITWLAHRQRQYVWVNEVVATISISSVLLLLWLLTGETRDFFERQLFTLGGDEDFTRLENLKQLSLSGLWLVYGIVLMILGIVRRTKGLRFLAIILLGISVLKIFIYDLSYLETLYRIFSFIGLGVILLASSYLYQRYKMLIFETPKESERT